MKHSILLSLALTVPALWAGTVVPERPASVDSKSDATVDTLVNPSFCAAADAVIDTEVMGWGWSPWPGIYLITKPCHGLYLIVK